MRVSFVTGVRALLVLMVVVGSAVLVSSSDTPGFTTRDKAYYADANLVNFVRPGLDLAIVSGEVATDGTIRVRFTLKDPKGLALDREGITTPGAVTLGFMVGTIAKGQRQYSSYITRSVSSTLTNQTATQAGADSGGTYEKLAEGEYRYTFKAKAPADYDRTATHTIGMRAIRDLTEFDLGRQFDNEVITFVPDGSKVATVRDVVRTQTCNRCHDPLAMHGGSMQKVEVCILCHQPQTTDPDTGNTVDFPVLIHKIHAGSSLPSVKGGKPYQIIGHNNTVIDFSTVAFPANVKRCEVCHDQKSGAAQADAYLKPNRAACGACHDDVNFATGENHVNLPQISDNQCTNCHLPQGELEFDASIKGAHMIAEFSKDLPGTTFQILDVSDGVAGKRPTVSFKVTDKAGNPIEMAKMTRLALTLAGPTTDYPSYIQEDVTKAQGPGDGTYFWTFKDPIASDAKGTFAVEIEGYRNWTLQPGTRQERTVRDAGISSVKYFSVDGSKVQPRRQVVALEKCNSCHESLSLHGGNRNRIEACVMCHNPNGTDSNYRPKDKQPTTTISFAHMIHRIHTGEESTSEFTIYGYHSSVNDFTEVRFPGDRRNCNACHVNGSEQPPLKDGLLQVQNPRGLLSPMGPITAACTGCHTGIATASHALSNTTEKLGEACAACHATGYEFGIPKVHAR